MATVERELTVFDETLRWVHDEIGLTYAEIGSILEVSEPTRRRWRSHDHQPRASQNARMEDLYEFRQVLTKVYREADDRREWLNSPSRMLRGRTPISFLRTGKLSRVVSVLAALESGAFQ